MIKKLPFVSTVFLCFFVICGSLNAAPPNAPGKLEHTQNTISAIYWRWDDKSNNEQGFRCYEWYWDSNLQVYTLSYNPVWSVNADISSYIESGLAPNTQYRRVIFAWNTDGISPSLNDWTPYRVAYYTSIEPPAGLVFGPKDFDFWTKKARLTVKLADPLPSNLLTSSNIYGYFNPNNSGFYIEEITTGKNISDTSFDTHDITNFIPAPPTADGWWKHNTDYDPLPPISSTDVAQVRFDHYLKNGPLTKSGTTWTCSHQWPYWCVENLEPNTPYRFRAKARNGDRDETAWCNTSEEIWTLPYDPNIKCDKSENSCYNMGTKFTFTSLIPFGVGTVDHYHIKWTTNKYDVPTEEDTKWETGNWVITENRGGDWYLVAISHNKMHEISGGYDYTGAFQENILSLGPFKVGYDVEGKVTISGGTGSYTDVVVHCGGNTTKCDSRGEYRFLHLPPGTYDVYAELPGYRIAYPLENSGHYSIKIPDEKDAPTYIKKGIDFTLAYKNTYTIAGKVSLIGGPLGIPSDVTQITITCGSYTANPDSKGNFYIPGVFAGQYKVKATLPLHDPKYDKYALTFPGSGQYIVFVGPDSTGNDFVFTWTEDIETASISGKIKLIGGTGDPSKATVYCKNLKNGVEGTTSPDGTGKYQFSSIPKGSDYELWVKMDGYKTSLPETGKITIKDLQEDQINQDFELSPISYYSITGRLDISEGIIKPPDVKLHLDCTSDTSLSFTLHPDVGGTFNFANVPEGTYTLYPEVPSGYRITNPVSGKYTGIVVGPDAFGKNFLVEPVAKYSLSGKITLQGGTCRPNEALVVCRYYNNVKKEYITFSTVPDSYGMYKFTNLVPANYTVYVNLPGYVTIYPKSESHAITISYSDVSGKDFYLISYAIKGKVSFLTPSVEPVTNVMVICSAISRNPDVPSVYKVVYPDTAGNYVFYNLMPSSKLADPSNGNPVPYRVEAFLEGYGIISPSDGYYDVFITNKDEQKDFVLGTYTVSGKLTLYSGTADLTKATVTAARLDKSGGDEIEWIVTNPDANGAYQITGLKAGNYYRIRVRIENFYSLKPKEQGLNWGYEIRVPPSATGKDFILYPATVPSNPTCTISGKVSISLPITPDRVVVHCGDLITYPDLNGNYYFKNLPPGTYDVWAERMGYHLTFPTTSGGHYYIVVNETNPVATGKDFVLAPDPVVTYKISGTVTLVGGTGKVTDVIVHCNTMTANPNVNGQYSFMNLPAGSYELWVELPKYQTTNPGGSGKQTIKLYDRDVAGVDFTMQAIPTYSIKGTVTISDGDVTQVKIVCSSGAVVNPDAFGRYIISDLLAGSYQVYAEMPGYIVISPKNNLYNVKVGPDAENCDFTIAKTYTISGTVTLSGGTGDVSNVVIKCGNKTGKPMPDGRYQFTELLPGTYEVYASLDGFTPTFPGSGSYKITVGPDATLKDFTLTATTLLSVSGKVNILNGSGNITDVVISAAGLTTHPDADGNYTLSGLSPGTYLLTATLQDYTTVAPSGGSYTITLKGSNLTGYNFSLATYSISGNVKVIGNGNVQSVVVSCDDGTTTKTVNPDANGNFVFAQLSAGTYKISASLPQFSTLLPGGDGTYTVQLGPSATNKNFALVAYSVSGKVSFYGTTGNITDVTITCKGPGIDITTHPDANGYYKIEPLPAGNYELSAMLPGYTVVSPNGGKYVFSLKGNLIERNFVISSFYIAGKVSLINSPTTVDKVTITLTGPSGTINTSPDEKGNYRFSILPAGSYTITASLTNHTVVAPSGGVYNVSIPQNATGKDFTLVAYSISGVVRVSDVSGPAGTVVYCEGPAGTLQYTVGNDGKFQFYPLPSADYKLWAEKPGYQTTYPAEGFYQFKLASFATKNFALQKR